MPKKYKLRAPIVEAGLLSTDNIEAVAKWCNGSIKGTSLPVHQQVVEWWCPSGEEITAEIGDYVVKFSDGYCSKMEPDRFHALYEEVI